MHQLPAGRQVAILAGRGECAPVRIVVAIATGGKRNVRIGHEHFGVFGARAMTLRAGDSFVQSGQRIFRGAVVESAGRLPGIERMASRAIGAKLSAMLVAVTRGAGWGKTQVGVVQIFCQNSRAPVL